MMPAYFRPQRVDLKSLIQDLVETSIPDIKLSGLAADSRQVKSGTLFIALSGVQTEGSLYISDAIRNGAVAVLYDPSDTRADLFESLEVPALSVRNLQATLSLIAGRFYGHPSRTMQIFAVTGTNGKSSVAHAIASALATEAPSATIGTLGAGVMGSPLKATGFTTPDPIQLQEIVADIADQGVRRLSVEISSHALDQGRAAGLQIDTAIFTNLTQDHLDYHGSMQAYAKTKATLFANPALRMAIINSDDPYAEIMAASLPNHVGRLYYGMNLKQGGTQPDIYPIQSRFHEHGFEAEISTPWGDVHLQSGLYGNFNLSNQMAALAALMQSGMELDRVIKALAQLNPVEGRMEPVVTPSDMARIVIDFAHTPDALKQALRALRLHTQQQLWVVFGAGGDRDRGKRPQMGAIAVELADRVIITSDNPRSENPQAIIDEIMTGISTAKSPAVESCRDRTKAINLALKQAKKGDIILIAGKGHERYQQIGNQKIPFSDFRVVADYIGDLNPSRGGA